MKEAKRTCLVLGTGDVAPRRGRVNATVLIDAETSRRADVV
jgi:hypothetical protein